MVSLYQNNFNKRALPEQINYLVRKSKMLMQNHIEIIRRLEKSSSILEPNSTERSELNQQVMSYSDSFLSEMEGRKAFEVSTSAAEKLLEPISEAPTELSEILEIIGTGVDGTGLNPASGGHLGYIPGGGIYASALGDYLAAISNRYAGIHFASPGAVNMERTLIRWLCDIFSFPKESGGTLCSGGSIANLTAIVAARDAHQIKGGKIETSVIYLTDQIHHCIQKALRIAGLGDCPIHTISKTTSDKMDMDDLELAIQSDRAKGLNPWMIIASAGTTDTGAIDPLEEIATIASTHGLWMHVDAAYGGFFQLCPGLAKKFKGIENAHSLVIDPHKGLFLPYGIGAVIVRREKDLLTSHFYLANYMQDAYQDVTSYSPADLSPELTRHFRAMRMWLPLKMYGLQPFRAALEEKYELAQFVARKLHKMDGIQLRTEPELSVVCFRIVIESDRSPDSLTIALVERIKEDGEVFLSSTRIDGKMYARMAILSFRTHLPIVQNALDKIQKFVEQLK